jgi:fatty-acyl-CoA synthase
MVQRAFNLADLFEIVADTVPDRLALVAGDARLTYRELDERATRFAHHLLDGAGVQPGEWVAIYSWNRAEWLEAMLGAYKARVVPVNVNYRYVADELRHILDDSGSVYVVHEPEFAPVLDKVRGDAPAVRGRLEIGDAYERALAAASPSRDGLGPRSADDLYVLYTGGTTGMPKGVEWRQEDIFFAALGGGGFGQPPISTPEELAGRVPTDDAARQVLTVLPPLMHGGGQWASFITFFAGGTVVLWTGRHLDAHEVWRLVERHSANSVMCVGDAMARPLAEALADGTESHDTSTVFVVSSGGAFLSPAVKAQLRAQLPNALVIDSFGASETGAGGSVLEGDAPRFLMGEFMTVLDDDLRPVEPGSGVVGRLARRGHVPLGYHNDPGKTAATFVTAADGTRWVVPGDAAKIEGDGTITLLGRGSQSINSGGEKIYPEEVEAALKSHPAVFDAIVVGIPDDRFVERVAAIVQPRDPAAPPTLESLQAHARERVAGYKLPRELRIVDAMPRTPVGKADYRAAKQLFSA